MPRFATHPGTARARAGRIRRAAAVQASTLALGAVVITATLHSQALPQDTGAGGTWLKLRKIATTASAMHTTAHPDDEHGGVLAMISRGEGARLALLTLNRGESGDNAIGSELFDGLGLIRTEELLVADRYYGVDDQYFTTVIDYGFSKRLDEALDKWGKENVLRDVVRVIRMNRPMVLIARFQGNQRDGHGNHQTAGMITQEAFKVAGDPTVFPEQIAEGLPAWQPLKLYMGGVRQDEDWTLRVDPGKYDAVLGESYANFSRIGLSFQRSQNSGRLSLSPGPSISFYKRLASRVEAPARENSFFDGIDTTIPGVYRALQKQAPPGAGAALHAIDAEVKAATRAFKWDSPAASVPALARALKATREASAKLGSDYDVKFVLRTKEQQIQDAINTALGVGLTARARPAGTEDPTGPFAAFAPPPTMGPVVPGQSFEVRTSFTSRGGAVRGARVTLQAAEWNITGGEPAGDVEANQPATGTFKVTVPENASFTKPYFHRQSVSDARYTVENPKLLHRAAAEPPLVALAQYEVDGVAVECREPVTRLEPNLPYGNSTYELAVVGAIAVNIDPPQAIVPLAAASKKVTLRAELVHNAPTAADGTLKLALPAGWKSDPPAHVFHFARSGERAFFPFTVTIPALESRDYRIAAVANAGGSDYRTGYDVIQHRDLETRYLYRDAASGVRGIDVSISPGLKVGYVMGIGDEVPGGIAQLGADVKLLNTDDLANADLKVFDAIVTGTRAYAVREDLKTYNQRLLEYVKNGGNLIVLYNTQEFVPNAWAPYAADLPRNAEEVSEEDSPVDILAPNDPTLNMPNTITQGDFQGWVEQRGSKFWKTWDSHYRPVIATWDKGQEKQQGGWLHARYGKGHYTYFAYALHRQLPYGVPGAYRLLANLLSLSKTTPGTE